MMLFEAETPNKQNMSDMAQNWFNAVKSVTGEDNGITMHHKGWASKGVYFVQFNFVAHLDFMDLMMLSLSTL